MSSLRLETIEVNEFSQMHDKSSAYGFEQYQNQPESSPLKKAKQTTDCSSEPIFGTPDLSGGVCSLIRQTSDCHKEPHTTGCGSLIASVMQTTGCVNHASLRSTVSSPFGTSVRETSVSRPSSNMIPLPTSCWPSISSGSTRSPFGDSNTSACSRSGNFVPRRYMAHCSTLGYRNTMTDNGSSDHIFRVMNVHKKND